MSKVTSEETPLHSQEECIVLLKSASINAMHNHKFCNKTSYHDQIDAIAKICDVLITQHHLSPQSIITHMETTMSDTHNKELEEIDKKIKYLFNLRKQAPLNTFYGEQEIIKQTTQICELEKCKSMPIKEIIHEIIYKSLEKAIKIHGTEMPDDFNLDQYEYHPDNTSEIQSNYNNHGKNI